MKCEVCGCEESIVLDTRHPFDGLCIRRRRQCANCGERFTTYEQREKDCVMVAKRRLRQEANTAITGVNVALMAVRDIFK